MKKQNVGFKSLLNYVDYLQSQGEYVFEQTTAKKALGCSTWAIRIAANRLMDKKRIIKLRYTFYLIIPLEYKSAGAPPPAWYIDALMKHQKQPYYVALLSAAALHGAAHQQAQVFQVMTNKPLRPIKVGRANIQFFVKKNINQSDIMQKQTETGYMNVSTPEVTAFDLVKYPRATSIDHFATILIELSEIISPEQLLKTAKKEKVYIIQRLGFLLELLEKHGAKKITAPLQNWLSKQTTCTIPLVPNLSNHFTSINKTWKILINKKIEVDDI